MFSGILRVVFSIFIFNFVFLGSIKSQEILTASQYFDRVYQKYQSIQDWKADIALSNGSMSSSGKLLFKMPSSFRIDFSDKRTFLKNGNKLTVYSPSLNRTFAQTLKNQSENTNPLSILKSEYSVSYSKGPDLEPLDDNSSEKVYKLLFRRHILKGATIRQMEISFTPDNIMRRVVAATNSGRSLILDFKQVQINTGLFDSQFNYEAPLSADIINNFLYDNI